MSQTCAFCTLLASSFPRVSGDEPFIINTVYTSGMFSPRERG